MSERGMANDVAFIQMAIKNVFLEYGRLETIINFTDKGKIGLTHKEINTILTKRIEEMHQTAIASNSSHKDIIAELNGKMTQPLGQLTPRSEAAKRLATILIAIQEADQKINVSTWGRYGLRGSTNAREMRALVAGCKNLLNDDRNIIEISEKGEIKLNNNADELAKQLKDLITGHEEEKEREKEMQTQTPKCERPSPSLPSK